MGDTAELLKLMAKQMEMQNQQMEMQAKQHREEKQQQQQQMEMQKQQMEMQKHQHDEQMAALMRMFKAPPTADSSAETRPVTASTVTSAIPPFAAFDSTSELWPDYWSRFQTFLVANAVPDQRKPQVFLTNQNVAIYRQLSTLATQLNPPKDINNLTMDEIVDFMKDQFDPKRFIVRERFKFWSDMQRKPGETLQELAARIRQDAATCDFTSIRDPQDEALRQRFICSVNNEAVLKALFKIKDNELTFTKAIQTAIETEDAAKVAKETVYGSKARPVNKVKHKDQNNRQKSGSSASEVKCYRCGKDHKATDCAHKESKCRFCDIKGHLEAVCMKKQRQQKD